MNDTIKTFFISEVDLATLEAELPSILEANYMSCNDPITRKKWEMVKSILSNVRWNYGPPLKVEKIDC
jgi:hypothetical protein